MDLIPGSRVTLLDNNTGLISREWYRFFYSLFSITGSGNNNASLLDLQTYPSCQEQPKSRSRVSATSISVGASPFNYTNNTGHDADIIVENIFATITSIEFSRDSGVFDVGSNQGMFRLSPYDTLIVTYTGSPPNMTLVPR
jgi:hypothetical protein